MRYVKLESKEIMYQMKLFRLSMTNNLDKAVIEISDGALKFETTKQTSSLTLKFIKKCLS